MLKLEWKLSLGLVQSYKVNFVKKTRRYTPLPNYTTTDILQSNILNIKDPEVALAVLLTLKFRGVYKGFQPKKTCVRSQKNISDNPKIRK